MAKILIPNATAPKNIGDEAILLSLLQVVRKFLPDPFITIHSYTPLLHDQKSADKFRYHIHGWLAFENRGFLTRLSRLIRIIISYLILWTGFNPPKIFTGSYLYELIQDYKDADLIVFTSGSYLRTNNNTTQVLNLLLQITPVLFAKVMKKKIIISPMSFGPFSNKLHLSIARKAIDRVHHICIREEISLKLLQPRLLNSPVSLIPDLALFLDTQEIKNTYLNKGTIGFTIREWFSPNIQKEFEATLSLALIGLAKKHNLSIRPIVQVDAIEYGDNDFIVTERIAHQLIKEGITVLPIKKNNSVEDALKTYSQIDFLIGTRMHSVILAAIVSTPFAALAYEHKTIGLANILNLDHCVVPINNAVSNPSKLESFFNNNFEKKDQIQATLLDKLGNLKIETFDKLKRILLV